MEELTINILLLVEMNLRDRNGVFNRKDVWKRILLGCQLHFERSNRLSWRHESFGGKFELDLISIFLKRGNEERVIDGLAIYWYCMAVESFTMIQETSWQQQARKAFLANF